MSLDAKQSVIAFVAVVGMFGAFWLALSFDLKWSEWMKWLALAIMGIDVLLRGLQRLRRRWPERDDA